MAQLRLENMPMRDRHEFAVEQLTPYGVFIDRFYGVRGISDKYQS